MVIKINLKKIRAFTLIEILVALFIFSIISIMTMRGLQTTLNSKEKSQGSLDQLAELMTAYNIIQQDLEQIINRNVLEPSGGLKLAFLVPIDNKASSGLKAGLKNKFGYNRLEFTRTGNNSSIIAQKTSDLQRIAYYQDNNMLVRYSWRQVDAVTETFVDTRRLLSNLENLNIYFVDEYGHSLDSWQIKASKMNLNPMQANVELPRGIIVNFNIKNYGNIEWVFALPMALNKNDNN